MNLKILLLCARLLMGVSSADFEVANSGYDRKIEDLAVTGDESTGATSSDSAPPTDSPATEKSTAIQRPFQYYVSSDNDDGRMSDKSFGFTHMADFKHPPDIVDLDRCKFDYECLPRSQFFDGGFETSARLPIEVKRQTALNFLKSNSIVFAMPTVSRSVNYLYQTISFMIDRCHPDELPFLKILILNAHTPPSAHPDVKKIRKDFARYITQGIIVIAEVPSLYRRLKRPIRQRYGDDGDRIYWRSKQVLDFAFLMETGASMADYYIQMEDDIKPIYYYMTEIAWWMSSHFTQNDNWFQLSFYSSETLHDRQVFSEGQFFGFIGQTFRATALAPVVKYFRSRFDESPCDWLISDYMKLYAKDNPDKASMYVHHPSVFEHLGKSSSLKKKIQSNHASYFAELQDLIDHPPFIRPRDSLQEIKGDAIEFFRKKKVLFTVISENPTLKKMLNLASMINDKIGIQMDYSVFALLINANLTDTIIPHTEILNLNMKNVSQSSMQVALINQVTKRYSNYDYVFHLNPQWEPHDDFMAHIGWWINARYAENKTGPYLLGTPYTVYDRHVFPNDLISSLQGLFLSMSDVTQIRRLLLSKSAIDPESIKT